MYVVGWAPGEESSTLPGADAVPRGHRSPLINTAKQPKLRAAQRRKAAPEAALAARSSAAGEPFEPKRRCPSVREMINFCSSALCAREDRCYS